MARPLTPDGNTVRGRALRRLALAVAVTYVLLGGTFIAGEAFADPGGWAAVAIVAAWLAPLAGAGSLALWRPDLACLPLTVTTGAMVGFSTVAAILGDEWSGYEDRHGPVRAIAMFALSGALAAFGYKRPVLGGVLLLVAGVVPGMLGVVTGGPGTAAVPVVAVPGVCVGVLYLLSSRRPRLTHAGGAPPHA